MSARRDVALVMREHHLSERQACRLLDVDRTTYRSQQSRLLDCGRPKEFAERFGASGFCSVDRGKDPQTPAPCPRPPSRLAMAIRVPRFSRGKIKIRVFQIQVGREKRIRSPRPLLSGPYPQLLPLRTLGETPRCLSSQDGLGPTLTKHHWVKTIKKAAPTGTRLWLPEKC